MQEIAEIHDISKSAVSDIIKRSYDQLCNYEEKLGNIRRSKDLDDLIMKMENDINTDRKYIRELKKINRG